MSDEMYPRDSLGEDGFNVSGEDMAKTKIAEREAAAARLRQARIKAGFKSMPAAVKAMRGLVKVDTYKAHEVGRNGFDIADARVYGRTFGVSASWLMTGTEGPEEPEEPEIIQEPEIPAAPVLGEVAAGRFMRVDFHDEPQYEPVPFVPGRYPTLRQFAYRVVGQSMDLKRIEDGDFVICVPYDEARVMPQAHDIVVVEAYRDGEVERTCKELIIRPDAFELRPQSSNPAFTSYTFPRSAITDAPPWPTQEDHITVRLVGLVIGRFRPFN